MSDQVSVLGIDLGSVRWQDNGSALLTFERGDPSRWIDASWSVITWPDDQDLTVEAMATVIDDFVRENGIAAVSLDGPQGWREPDPVPDRCQRLGEREANTQGKTGTYGTSYPATQLRWFRFCIELFERLLSLEWTQLANNRDQLDLHPLKEKSYWLIECYPTSTWRRSQLPVLPGKTNPVCSAGLISDFATALWTRYSLPAFEEWTGSHDDLQAVVSALPAAALLGGPCRPIANGRPGWIQGPDERIPEHCVEGIIWDAGLPDGAPLAPIEIPQIQDVNQGAGHLDQNNPLIVEDLDHGAGAEAIGRGILLLEHFLDAIIGGDCVGIGYKQFACFIHGVAIDQYDQIVGRRWSQADTPYVLQLAHQVTIAAGGPNQVDVAGVPINLGMDAFIWQQKRPHNRNPAAFPDAEAEVAWRAVFPDGKRRLVTHDELANLLAGQ